MSEHTTDDLLEVNDLSEEPRRADGVSVPAAVLAVVSGAAAGWATVQALRGRRGARRGYSEGEGGNALSPGLEAAGATDAQPSGFPTTAPQVAAHVSASPGRPAYAGDSHWAPPTKYLVSLGLILFGLFVLYLSRSVLSIIVTAALIAFIIQPLIGWFHNKLRFPRSMATAVSYLIVALLILAVPLLVVPALWDGITELQSRDFDPFLESSRSFVAGVLQWLGDIPVVGDIAVRALAPLQDLLLALEQEEGAEFVTPDSIVESLNVSFSSLGAITGFLGVAVVWVLTAAFTLLISIYLTSSKYSVRRFVLDKLPAAYVSEVATLFDRISWTWSSFLQGQLKLMVFIGVTVFLGNVLLGNRYAIVLGLVSGLLELIPSLGPALALIPGIFVALVFGSEWSWMPANNFVFAIIVLIFYLLVQAFENQIVVPRVLGDAVELPPLVVLIGVLVGGSAAGILGALIAVPVIGTAKEVVSYLYGKIIEAPGIEAPPPLEPGIVGNLKSIGRRFAVRLFGQPGAGA